jgi:pimeloyl-ACP methyl ester carboxylesterase
MKSRIALEDGTQIEYLENGSGQPLVFLHGAGGVPSKAAFIPELARTFRVLAPARPGYDGSTGTCQTSRDEAEVMAAFIRQAARGGPVHLIAESAGGASGCWVAVLYPELVATLVLVAPAAFAMHRERPTQPPTADEIELVLFGPHPSWSEPPTAEDRAVRERNASANAALIRPADHNQALLERLREIAAPTLILWGTADRQIPPTSGQIYRQHIPNSTRIYIYGAAHALPVASCQKFVALTTQFIQRGEAFVVNAPADTEGDA